ncbi:ABC transporter substrate-binding protein [Cohnella herbarum]|uniref:Carbohydrate ABC transporter substrate-binding protein n=1 Tax=Cohnella herbarum TaxID=2728023 RepID=A0A7Z2ZP51_9BACL|nr:ABC transporter substrate-binding protein [Cohnella herbarum]QJD86525.1 carbohydrate ABC transporter substrate-binding protein [Cohnella herbarum]
MKKLIIGLTLVALSAGIAGCSGSSSKGDETTLRIAMVSPGEGVIKVWEQIKEKYEEAHPDVNVELNYQEDAIYQSIGLPNLLSGENAPDIYFEWAGERLKTRIESGYAADLTEALKQDGLKDAFSEGDFKGMEFDGKTYMIPTASDVSNIIWYNKKIFADLGIQPPQTWEQFIEICEKIKAANITPLASGNKDLWPGGNWIAHLISRVVGEQAYGDALQLKQPFNSPDFVTALGYVQQLWENKYINDSVNAIADDEGDVLFFNGQAAMHPIGSWLVSSALESAPELELGYFNLPSMPNGKGDQTSVLGVQNGFAINAKSAHFQEAVDFMALYSSVESSKLLADAGAMPIAKGGIDPEKTDALSLSLIDMMKQSTMLVSPPDTGYNIEVANAFNMAISQVLGGVRTPAAALAELDNTIAPLKK